MRPLPRSVIVLFSSPLPGSFLPQLRCVVARSDQLIGLFSVAGSDEGRAQTHDGRRSFKRPVPELF